MAKTEKGHRNAVIVSFHFYVTFS